MMFVVGRCRCAEGSDAPPHPADLPCPRMQTTVAAAPLIWRYAFYSTASQCHGFGTSFIQIGPYVASAASWHCLAQHYLLLETYPFNQITQCYKFILQTFNSHLHWQFCARQSYQQNRHVLPESYFHYHKTTSSFQVKDQNRCTRAECLGLPCRAACGTGETKALPRDYI